MMVKAFWLCISMILCFVNSQCYFQVSYNFSKKQVCYAVGFSAISMLLFNFFKYQYIYRCPSLVKRLIDTNTPKDIQKLIIQYENQLLLKDDVKTQYIKKIVKYPMYDMSTPEYLFYPANLGNNVLVKQTTVGYTNPNDLIPREKEPCFFNTQFWITSELVMRISHDTTVTNHSLEFTKALELKYITRENPIIREAFIVDSINIQDTTVIGINDIKDSKSCIYIIKVKMQKKSFDGTVIEPIMMEDSLLYTLMIHPSRNTVAYANVKTKEDNTQQNEIHIVDDAYAYEKSECKPMDYYTVVDFGIKKLTFFGGGTYAFLTLTGQLGMIWQEYNEKGEIILQYKLKEIVNSLGQKIQTNYIDFTPDTTRSTESGFMPYWAFLNEQGEIFKCEFLAPLAQTTLFLKNQAPAPDLYECFDKIYFHDKKCGILYKVIDDKSERIPYTKLILYS